MTSWFKRLKEGLKKTSSSLTQSVTQIFTHRKLDDEMLDELEELLIRSDFGVNVASSLVQKLKSERYQKDIDQQDILKILAFEIEKILIPVAKPLLITPSKPHVILVVGVNGNGKTTTIGKLGAYYKNQGLKVMFAAGDTFRAAAIGQLKIWGERLDIPVYTKDEGSDAAAVAFDAFKHAEQTEQDLLIIDTAGRLHNHQHLMAELEKITRTLQKINPSAPHDTLLILDATTGQNAFNQIAAFKELAKITGLILTKLDGSAKGGVVVGLAEKFDMPIHALGVGESIHDLQPFEAKDFSSHLLGISE
jgi:fused signal recognition particle receptor